MSEWGIAKLFLCVRDVCVCERYRWEKVKYREYAVVRKWEREREREREWESIGEWKENGQKKEVVGRGKSFGLWFE